MQDNLALPKYTSPIVAKFLKPLCVAYTDLVTAYNTNNAAELRTTINKYQVSVNWLKLDSYWWLYWPGRVYWW